MYTLYLELNNLLLWGTLLSGSKMCSNCLATTIFAFKGLSLEQRGQLTEKNLGIGVYLTELESTTDTKPCFTAVHNFYVEIIKKMQNKFPFDDRLMKDLGVLQPEDTASFPSSLW